mmetsp:Transcript_10567/g.25767  ORF Transcript_10567/g.25767 Transcript_10567/m.25767 type:complete len:301 (-) Transcript_10567:211-1113(-)
MTATTSEFFPIEYQDWILLLVTFSFFFSFLLPFYLTGLSSPAMRKLGQRLQQKLLLFYAAATVANLVLLILVLGILPDWSLPEYIEWFGIGVAEAGRHLNTLASSGLILFCFFLLFVLRDRIKILLGIENQPLFRFSMKDVYSCCGFGSNDRAIEIYVHRVEELTSSSVMRANDLFVELALGDNERVRTRVHKQAGSGALMKETMQLNWDPSEDEEKLFVYCKTQNLMGSSEVAHLELSNADVRQIIEQNDQSADVPQFKLFPQGKISLSICYVDEEGVEGDYDGLGGGGYKWSRLLSSC